MASTINIAAYSDALVVLGTAGVVVPLANRFGLSPVLAYLGAGALLGPLGLGTFIQQAPILYWFTIVDAKSVAGIADLGVVFLLFLIGLELSFERLKAMRRLVFGLGALQVVVTTALIAVLLVLFGLRGPVAVLIGACLALSSTAIVLDVLSRQGRLATGTGRASFSILLAQDLAVIPLLMFVSILGAGQGNSVLATIGLALGQAIAAAAVIVLVGRSVLRPLFRQVARTRSSELFIATILFVIVATGVVAAQANLSMALGAFVAGLLLAETEYRKAIEATIDPFKGLLLGVFFFTVGMSIDIRVLVAEPARIAAAVLALVALKAIVLVALARWYNVPTAAAVETGLLLGPAGEFAFVGIGLAATLGIVSGSAAAFTLAVVSLSMCLIPLLGSLSKRMTATLAEPSIRPSADAAALLAAPEAKSKHAIVVGYGRVGKVVCGLLQGHGVAYTAVDHDADDVAEDRRRGHAVYFGDGGNPLFLRTCGLADAAGVIVTLSSRAEIDAVVEQVRQARPDILIVARARDADHASHLYDIGVTDAVPETIEASLQLSEAALVGLGVAAGPAIASIHERRDEMRRALQKAASAAGMATPHSLRKKLSRRGDA